MKKIIISLAVLFVVGIVGFVVWKNMSNVEEYTDTNVLPVPIVEDVTINTDANLPVISEQNKTETVLGTTVQGRKITAYHFGSGDKEVLFVGGAHGGYEWNTTLVSYELMDYLKANPSAIPAGLKVSVIPVLNPDGLFKVVGKEGRFAVADVPSDSSKTVVGRYNANGVDLNRNFDCDWQATGVWRDTSVSGGTAAFSEPESKAFQSYVKEHNLASVIVWFSSAGGVFSSSCHNDVSAETSVLTNLYANASGYPAFKDFDFYAITGDMVNWLAKNNIPAISVLLSSHDSTEWSKNQAGVNAVLQHYAK